MELARQRIHVYPQHAGLLYLAGFSLWTVKGGRGNGLGGKSPPTWQGTGKSEHAVCIRGGRLGDVIGRDRFWICGCTQAFYLHLCAGRRVA